MNDIQNQTYVIGMAANGVIRALGMFCEDIKAVGNDPDIEKLPYTMEDFEKLTEENGLYHNNLVP